MHSLFFLRVGQMHSQVKGCTKNQVQLVPPAPQPTKTGFKFCTRSTVFGSIPALQPKQTGSNSLRVSVGYTDLTTKIT